MNTGKTKQPTGSYLIVGSGRLATHLTHYFSLFNISIKIWNKSEPVGRLNEFLSEKPVVLLAISDDALESFFENHLSEKNLTVAHFSGAFHSDRFISCHPLMTFGEKLYEFETYKKIFFAVTGVQSLQDVFPFLQNPSFVLSPKDKSLYHALCVLTAAGAQTIWSQSEELLKAIGVPEKALKPYINQIAQNYLASGTLGMTGPWVRGDEKTISSNLSALKTKSDGLHKVYEILKEGHDDNT